MEFKQLFVTIIAMVVLLIATLLPNVVPKSVKSHTCYGLYGGKSGKGSRKWQRQQGGKRRQNLRSGRGFFGF